MSTGAWSKSHARSRSTREVMLLDEPAAGLSHADKARLAGLLRRIAEAGMTVLLVEHDMALVMGISDQVVVLDAGQHLAAGTPAEIQGNAAVRQAYLGESLAAARRRAPKRASRRRRAAGRRPRCSPATARSRCCTASTCRCGSGEAVALLGANGAGKRR